MVGGSPGEWGGVEDGAITERMKGREEQERTLRWIWKQEKLKEREAESGVEAMERMRKEAEMDDKDDS